MKDSIFRKYDIRGIAETDLDNDTISKLGFVLGQKKPGGVFAIGRDCRPSGERLKNQLARGAQAAGCKVIDLGVQTTPMTYFAAYTLKPDITVMITGSHNPAGYNGFKMMLGTHTLWGKAIEEIHTEIKEMDPISTSETQLELVSIKEQYLNRLRAEFAPPVSLKIAVDAGNGTGGECAVELLTQLGHRVIPLFCDVEHLAQLL